MEKSNIEIVKEVLAKYKPRKRNYEEKGDLWEKCHEELRLYKYIISKETCHYISWPPDNMYFSRICFDKSKQSKSRNHFHVVNDKCDISDVCFCINCNTLEITEHEIGKCPHSEYQDS